MKRLTVLRMWETSCVGASFTMCWRSATPAGHRTALTIEGRWVELARKRDGRFSQRASLAQPASQRCNTHPSHTRPTQTSHSSWEREGIPSEADIA
jgi:hypothetical protein